MKVDKVEEVGKSKQVGRVDSSPPFRLLRLLPDFFDLHDYDGDVPTPLGHGLAGIATGWAVAGVARESRRALIRQAAILAALAMAADLDLLVGAHSGPTHSIGAAAIAGVVAALARWPIARTRVMIGLVAFLAGRRTRSWTRWRRTRPCRTG